MSSNITKYGKIRYIEPNAILQDKRYGYYDENKKFITDSYNIPHNMEDYSISVDLVVNIPKRNGNATNETHTVSLNGAGDNISFFSGTDGFLTDMPGSTTYYDLMGKDFKGDNESLGITNIRISYNSYFVPEVTINFTDIRGAALMMPHEENYRREEQNKKDAAQGKKPTYDTMVENFFASLFSFPYPEFKLRVKGFYGKPIEYSLLVSDFRSAFNAQTGNFDATVKFVGKMFGEYTDIPMSYLIMAPYCKYGANNKTLWEKNNFTLNGIPMPTFVELRQKLLQANQELTTDMSHNSVRKYSEVTKRLEDLNVIKDAYNEYCECFTKKGGNKVISGKKWIDDVWLFEIGKYEINSPKKLKASEALSYLYPTNTSDLRSAWQSLSELITRYNSNAYLGTALPFPGGQKPGGLIGGDNLLSRSLTLRKVNNGTNVIHFICTDIPDRNLVANAKKTISTNGVSCNEVFGGLFNYLNDSVITTFRTFEPNTEKNYYVYYAHDFANALNKQIEDTKNELKNLKEEVSKEYTNLMEELLGFVPSIRNIFLITMAHLQVFSEIFSTFLSNVKGRKVSEYGLSFDKTDLKKYGKEKDCDLPPFPAIFNNNDIGENGRTYEYPSDAHLKKIMEEERLVDSFFDGSFLVLDKENDNNELTASYTDESLSFIPLNLTDLITQENPYSHVFEGYSDTLKLDRVMFFFGMRLFQNLNYERRNSAIKDEELGKIEAYNFWRCNKGLDNETIAKLSSDDFSSSVFLNFLQGVDKTYIQNKPCYQVSENIDSIIKIKSSYVNETGKFNVPATLTSYNVFKQDVHDAFKNRRSFENGKTSFVEATGYGNEKVTVQARPLDFIKIIDDYSYLEEWKTQINNFNTSDICSDNAKLVILENQLLPVKSMFLNKTKRGSIYFREKSMIGIPFEGKQYKKRGFNNKNAINKDLYINIAENHDKDYTKGIYLDAIQCGNNKAYFIDANAKLPLIEESDRFLSCFHYNFEQLFKLIEDGQRLIRLPKITQIFLGRCLKKRQEIQDKLHEVNFPELLTGFNGEEIRTLNNIIECLMTSNDGKYIVKRGNISHRKYIDNDYLGLIQKYEKWITGNGESDFKQLYKAFTLSFRKNVTYQGVIPTNYEIVEYLIKHEEYINGKYTYDQIFKGDNKLKHFFLNYFGKSDFTNIKPKNIEDVLNEIYDNFTLKFAQVSIDADDFIMHLNDEAPGYVTLCNFVKSYSYLILPYRMGEYDNSKKGYITKSRYETAFNAFKKSLLKYYGVGSDTTNTKPEYDKMVSDNVSTEHKLTMYLSLKNLYDRHLHELNTQEGCDKFKIDSENSDMKRFHFVDTFYTDIGDKLIMNAETLTNIIGGLMGYEENGSGVGIVSPGMSLYSFMSKICQSNNMMLMALPVFNGAFVGPDGEKNIEAMFTPIPHNESVGKNFLSGTSYVCFYPHQTSSHLDIPNSEYENDGFDIPNESNASGVDLNDTANFSGPTTLRELFTESDDYIIPAFGVEYGIQNQGIFKNINVNMDNPQMTEQAVAITFDLARKNNEDVRKQSYTGQDLFRIYSNHSYTCNVEMMGCAQIQPLMYFQLNNIPMFRGAYQIIKVEHDITPGNMTTNFTGVRINKNKMPMVTSTININDILKQLTSQTALGESQNTKIKNHKFNGALYADLSGVDRYKDIPNKNYTYNDIVELNGTQKVVTFYNITSSVGGDEGAFNASNPELRKLTYGIANRAKETVGGIAITSMARTKPEYIGKSSDHATGNNVSARRKRLSGLDASGNTVTYDKMGCAVDILALNKNGIIDKQESSIALFDMIALEFTNNIRQLIWEVSLGSCTSNNYISNCIHLSSYGHDDDSCNDKKEIYVALGDKWNSIEADNGNDVKKVPTNIPPMFIKILYRMALAGINLNEFKFNNFPKIKLTKEILDRWCKELGV